MEYNDSDPIYPIISAYSHMSGMVCIHPLVLKYLEREVKDEVIEIEKIILVVMYIHIGHAPRLCVKDVVDYAISVGIEKEDTKDVLNYILENSLAFINEDEDPEDPDIDTYLECINDQYEECIELLKEAVGE